jgi:hypothetical protein
MLLRTLHEADASVSLGEVRSMEASVKKLGKAFDLYWSRCQADIAEPLPATPAMEARRMLLRSLAALLNEIEGSIATGDIDSIRAAIRQAKEAVEDTAALDGAPRQSEIRSRFPSRMPKAK